MNALSRFGALVAVLAVCGCTQSPPATAPAPQPVAPPDTRAADEAAIRANVKDWSAAAQAKDAAKFASYYGADATLMLEDAPDVHGPAAIRDAVADMMKDPNFGLSFAPDTVVVARSSDIAYETGTYSLTMSGPNKKPATENGHYTVVWRKQPEGGWKVALDIPVSDPPAPATPPSKR
jgi:uncharacterized protein (TIGR02246 family)